MHSSMTFLYLCYKSEQQQQKDIQKINWTWGLTGFGGEGGETNKDNSQLSDVHNCLSGYIFRWERKQHFSRKDMN